MSWSFGTKGTKAGARAQIAAAKNYATAETEEYKVAEGARATLLALIDGVQPAGPWLVVVNANASGHGPSVTSLVFGLEYVAGDPAVAVEDRPKPPDPNPSEAASPPAEPPSGATAP